MPVCPSATSLPDAGDLLTQPYQYQLGTWLGGSGTSFVIEKVSGLLGHADVRDIDLERGNGHGSIPLTQFYEPRTIQFDIKGTSQHNGTPVEDLLDLLSDNFQLGKIRTNTQLQSFAYWRPGRTPRQFFGRATKFDADSDYEAGRGLVTASVEFVANDPLSYALEATESSVTIGSGEASDSLTVFMEGNCKNGSPPLLYIAGACVNPRIECDADDGRDIKLDVTLAANQICRIDVDKQEVTIQTGGGSNPWVPRWDTVRDDNQWWHLMPGENEITLSRTGTATSCVLTVEFFDAWARG